MDPEKIMRTMARVVSVPSSMVASPMPGTRRAQHSPALGCVWITAFLRFSSSL
jgi:hypothetical protein